MEKYKGIHGLSWRWRRLCGRDREEVAAADRAAARAEVRVVVLGRVVAGVKVKAVQAVVRVVVKEPAAGRVALAAVPVSARPVGPRRPILPECPVPP